MKHRRIRPRTDIPDWRDPDMPVLTPVQDQWGHRRMRSLTPKERSYFSQCSMNDPSVPSWHDDPTYNIRKQ